MRLRYSDIGKFQVTGRLLLCIFRGVAVEKDEDYGYWEQQFNPDPGSPDPGGFV
jgi:hypothetical protein